MTAAFVIDVVRTAEFKRGRAYGLQSMCEGGGMANAMIVEAL